MGSVSNHPVASHLTITDRLVPWLLGCPPKQRPKRSNRLWHGVCLIYLQLVCRQRPENHSGTDVGHTVASPVLHHSSPYHPASGDKVLSAKQRSSRRCEDMMIIILQKWKRHCYKKMQDIGRVCIEVVLDVSHWTETVLKHQIQQWHSDQCRQYVPCSCYSHWNVLLPIAVCCVNS